jgi:hypothetical protein
MKRIFNYTAFITIIALYIILLPFIATAQMFSIEETQEQRQQRLGAVTVIGLSWEFADFKYTGDSQENFQRLDFNDSLLRFRLNSPGLEISFGLGGSFTGMNDHSYLNITGRIFNNINIIRRENFLLILPIQLTTDLKRVRLNDFDNDFQQSSLIFGTGIGSDFKLSDRFRLKAHATPNYGFSFSQGNFFGGNLFRFDGRTMLFVNNLFGNRSIAIGYDFDYRSYNIDGDIYDYDYTAHSITLGIGF